jgi:uncharacterized membrane protein YkvA (DUF1232 family)
MGTLSSSMFSRLAPLIALRQAVVGLWAAFRDPKTPRLAKVLLVAAALYVISPFDIVPDVMPILGWLDDAAVIPLALTAFAKLAARRRQR